MELTSYNQKDSYGFMCPTRYTEKILQLERYNIQAAKYNIYSKEAKYNSLLSTTLW